LQLDAIVHRRQTRRPSSGSEIHACIRPRFGTLGRWHNERTRSLALYVLGWLVGTIYIFFYCFSLHSLCGLSYHYPIMPLSLGPLTLLSLA
jgi:hypothetical protein